eukprot:9030489-Alexandrium_andersonii.AAC.1
MELLRRRLLVVLGGPEGGRAGLARAPLEAQERDLLSQALGQDALGQLRRSAQARDGAEDAAGRDALAVLHE